MICAHLMPKAIGGCERRLFDDAMRARAIESTATHPEPMRRKTMFRISAAGDGRRLFSAGDGELMSLPVREAAKNQAIISCEAT